MSRRDKWLSSIGNARIPTFRLLLTARRLSLKLHVSFLPPPTIGAVALYLPSHSCTYTTMSAQQSTDQGFEKRSSVEPVDQIQMLSTQKDANEDLPPPVSAQVPRQKQIVSAAAIIPIWIILSSTVILYNNHLYTTLNFRYPVFLVTWHLTFAVRSTPRRP